MFSRFRTILSNIWICLFTIVFCVLPVSLSWAAEADGTYLIGPEDVLEISVWKDEALTRVVVVRPDGKISFPLVGELCVARQTVAWAREQIKEKLSGFMSEIEVTVTVNQVNSVRVYLIGKVLRPGEYKIGRAINVMQALALAGGMAPFADEDEILILRTESDGGQSQIPFDYKAVKRGKVLEQNVPLKTGDVVVVP